MEENLEKETEVIEEVEDKKLSKKQVKKYEKEIEDLNTQVFDWQQKYALALNTAAHQVFMMSSSI